MTISFKNIIFVKDGYEFTAAVQEQKYGAIILDHHLNKSNSLNAISGALNSRANTETPIIFTYNSNIDEEEKRDIFADSKSAGVSGILGKPLSGWEKRSWA